MFLTFTEQCVIDFRQMDLLTGLWMAGIVNGKILKLLLQHRATIDNISLNGGMGVRKIIAIANRVNERSKRKQ